MVGKNRELRAAFAFEANVGKGSEKAQPRYASGIRSFGG